MKPVKIQYELTYRDLSSVIWGVLLGMINPFAGFGLVFMYFSGLFAVVGAVLIIGKSVGDVLGGFIFLGGIAAVFAFLPLMSWRKTSEAQKQVEVTVGPEGYHYRDGQSELHHGWSAFKGWSEDRKIMFLVPPSGPQVPILKRTMTAEQLESLRAGLRDLPLPEEPAGRSRKAMIAGACVSVTLYGLMLAWSVSNAQP